MPDRHETLRTQLSRHIEFLEAQSRSLKRITYTLRISVMVLSGVSTVILGWTASNDASYGTFARNTALLIGAIVTLVSGIAAFWNIDQYWMRTKLLLLQLLTIQLELDYLTADGQAPTPEATDRLFADFKKALQSRHEYWSSALDGPARSTVSVSRIPEGARTI